jgi:hypothetical protein
MVAELDQNKLVRCHRITEAEKMKMFLTISIISVLFCCSCKTIPPEAVSQRNVDHAPIAPANHSPVVLGFGPTGTGDGSEPYFMVYTDENVLLEKLFRWSYRITPLEMANVIDRLWDDGYLMQVEWESPEQSNYRLIVYLETEVHERWCTKAEFDTFIDVITACDRVHRAVFKGNLTELERLQAAGEDLCKRAVFRNPLLSPAKQIGGGRYGIGTNSLYWEVGDMPIYVALMADENGGHRQIIEYLIAHKAHLTGNPPLVMYCVANNKVDYLKTFVRAGASLDVGWYGGTPLDYAIRHNKSEMIKILRDAQTQRASGKDEVRTGGEF